MHKLLFGKKVINFLIQKIYGISLVIINNDYLIIYNGKKEEYISIKNLIP